jgi:tetratricopeptide (TPR) repeat protein
MKAPRGALQSRLAYLLALTLWGTPALAQPSTPKDAQPAEARPRRLAGDDARSAQELETAINAALKADRFDTAIARTEELLALRVRAQGPTHFETMTVHWRLKTLHLVQRMTKRDRSDFQLSSTLNEQAVSLDAQGKYAEAQPLYNRALELNRRLLTDEHPQTAMSYHNLASNLRDRGKYAEAQGLFEKALAIDRRLFTDEHPETAHMLSGLASNMSAQGKYTAAGALYQRALAIRRRLLTDDHLDTARNYNDLGVSLQDQGMLSAAQASFEKALEIKRRLLTDDHPSTAVSYSNLGSCLDAYGNHAAAQPALERSLEIKRRLLGDEHPSTAVSYHNLAHNLSAQKKYAQAQRLFEKALEIKRRVLPDGHPNIAESLNSVGYVLQLQEQFAQAQPFLEQALEILRSRLPEDHPLVAQSYNNLAGNLMRQGKYVAAQPLFEKALEIYRRVLGDEHPHTALGFSNLASNLTYQEKYAQAQALCEKALVIRRRLLTDLHPDIAASLHNAAWNLRAEGKYVEARDHWIGAVKSLDAARLRVAFTGMERSAAAVNMRLDLAAVLARLNQPAEAWRRLEEDLGRGLLDELAARQDRRLSPAERAHLRDVTSELARLDRVVETFPKGLDLAERAKRFEDLKGERERASIALGEFQAKLVETHGPLAGEVADLSQIQAALPADTAFVSWIDIPAAGPSAADPAGDHWGVVVRARGAPAWIALPGTGAGGLWTGDDAGLLATVRAALRSRSGAGSKTLQASLQRLRGQRLDPLSGALSATTDSLPAVKRIIVLPSRAMAGIPLEALLAPDKTRTVSYAPSATVFKYLREQPRPDRHAGLLALGDPVFERRDSSSDSQPLPERGLLINMVVPGSNAATHGLKPGDVLLTYNGVALNTKDDLKVVSEGDKPVVVDFWRDGRSAQRDLAPGKLGVVLDPRPAPLAIAEGRKLQQVLVATREGGEDLPPLPGTRYEVEALAQLFQSDDRPTRILLGSEASEPALDRVAASGELGTFGFIHLATHGVLDESVPARSAVILTQTGLPDPLEQALNHRPVFDGRLSVGEIQRGWDLKAELVTLSACETALGGEAGGEGFVGFTQALLMSGARSVCLSLWKVDDTATALLMQRFYANLLGRRPGLAAPMPKAEALREAKAWLRSLRSADAQVLTAQLSGGIERSKDAKTRQPVEPAAAVPTGGDDDRPYTSPHFWAAFVLVGDPD